MMPIRIGAKETRNERIVENVVPEERYALIKEVRSNRNLRTQSQVPDGQCQTIRRVTAIIQGRNGEQAGRWVEREVGEKQSNPFLRMEFQKDVREPRMRINEYVRSTRKNIETLECEYSYTRPRNGGKS